MKLDNLKDVRESIGMTQMELSEKSGINQSRISLYENGVHSPNLNTVKKLVEAMNMEICLREKQNETTN